MISRSGEKAILTGARSIVAVVGVNEVGVVLPDILIYRFSQSVWVIIISGGDNEVGLPTLD